MLYGRGGDGGGGYSDFRVIATDGRAFDPQQTRQTKYTGHSVGHWEGDTLVIESVGFTPETWLARGGFFHSEDMKVFERFTRKGDQMLYEVTVEDPQVLLQPWTLKPMLLSTGGHRPARWRRRWRRRLQRRIDWRGARQLPARRARRHRADSPLEFAHRAPGVDQTSGARASTA